MSIDDVTLPRATVQALIDLALTGDAGMSGHMNDEEVELMRSAAVAIGIDPMGATPQGFYCKYRGEHNFGSWTAGSLNGKQFRNRVCRDCGKYEYSDDQLSLMSVKP